MKPLAYQMLFLSFFCLSCNFNSEQIDFSKKTTPQLLEYFLTSKDSTEINLLIKMLQDSIIKSPDFQFFSEDYVDSEKEDFKVKYHYYDSRLDDVLIKERNVYVAIIYNRDELKFEGKYIANFSEVTNEIKEFILNPENKENLPQKKLSEIDYFGEVLISKQAFIIYPNLTDSLTYKANWLIMKETILFFYKTYKELRNEIALQKFGQAFNKLTIQQKESIVKFISTRIAIVPQWEEWEIKQPSELNGKMKYGS